MTIQVFEAFAGYGSQALALQKLQAADPRLNFQYVGISEVDPRALKAYRALHGEVTNYGDISKIEWGSVPDFDLFTYSFPCQDISIAGTQKGLEEGSDTRSSLLWQCKKAIETKRPKYLLMENVKALTNKRFMPSFERWMQYLRELGYTNHYQVLNAKDYGVPQNRERVFMVSILGEEKPFHFPKGFPLKRRLCDLLEEDVLEKYYLKKDHSDTILQWMQQDAQSLPGPQTDRIIQLFNLYPKRKGKDRTQGRIYSAQGISPTINTRSGGGLEPKIILPINTDKSGCSVTIPSHYHKAGWTDFRPISQGNQSPHVGVIEFSKQIRIRRLTPIETGRLMGLTDKQVRTMRDAKLSDSALYRLHGNSIVVDVLFYLFRALFEAGDSDRIS
jgi:DNA (cytosine-5)-methyltransferase 1